MEWNKSLLLKKYSKKQEKLKKLDDSLKTSINHYKMTEEKTAALEKKINTHMLDIKSTEKSILSISEKISQKKKLNLPEKNQISDINTFISASKSIFTSQVFKNLDENSKEAQSLQGRSGEILLKIAKISEQVSYLKQNIHDIKRAESELKMLSLAEKSPENRKEFEGFSSQIVKVTYKSWNGHEDSCDFPLTDYEGVSTTFSKLLKNACRYWHLTETNCVLVDSDLAVWPGGSNVKDETQDREIWLMLKEEANYIKAVKKENKEFEVPNAEVTQIDEPKNETIETERHPAEDLDLRERKKNTINLLIYGLFILGFTWTLITFSSVQNMFWTKQGVQNVLFGINFPVNSSSPVSFATVTLNQDFENFMMEPFLDSFYKDLNYNGDEFSEYSKLFLEFSYRKIGPVRFLQKKVQERTCRSVLDYFKNRDIQCQTDWSEEYEYTKDLDTPNVPESWLKFQSFSSPRKIKAVLNSYNLNGYIAYLDKNLTFLDACSLVNSTINNWIDLQTRLFVISSNLCNFNADFCLSIDLIFEFNAGGGVIPSQNIQVFRPNLNWKKEDKIRLIIDVITGAILLYFVLSVIVDVKKKGCKTVFSNLWNILMVLLAVSMFIFYMLILAYTNLDELKNFKQDAEEFKDYMKLGSFYNIVINFWGVTSFLAYFLILSFLQKSKGLKVIWSTLNHSKFKLIFFFLVFILVYIGWVLLAYKGFGEFLQSYHNIGTTSTTLLSMLVGNANFDEIYNVQAEFAGFFFFLFIFLNYFIMLNIFLAIINESYQNMISLEKNEKTDEMIMITLLLIKGIKTVFFSYPYRLITCKVCKRPTNSS